MIFKFFSNSITNGLPVGISNSLIFSSEILNKNLHSALKEFPCAETKIFLSSDKLLLLFSEQKNVIEMKANGTVEMMQGQRKASARHAKWLVKKDVIVLSGDPVLRTENGTFSGGKITISPSKKEVKCEQGCRLVLETEK